MPNNDVVRCVAVPTRLALANSTSTGWRFDSFTFGTDLATLLERSSEWYWRQELHPHLPVRSRVSWSVERRQQMGPEQGVEPWSAVYETAALPLSYTGNARAVWWRERGSNPRLRRMRPTSCRWTIPRDLL